MQKTKVVIIHNIVSPHVTNLFQELSKLVELKVLYCAKTEDNRSWKDKLSGFKYKILQNFSIKLKGADLFTYFINPDIVKELDKAKPQVVVIAGWDLFSYQVAFFYCKIKGIKLILWSGSTDYEKSWRRSLSLPLVKLIVAGSDACIAYGTRARDYLIKLGADKKKIYIYNHSTNVKNFKKLNITNTKSVKILFYGQLIERKGIDILIKAFMTIKDSMELFIVGSGQLERDLKQNFSAENIHFFDYPGDEKAARFFSEATVFVLPSREEVWGLAVNMAMQCGLPVVVSDACGCASDLVKDGVNGYSFKSESVNDLQKKILLATRRPKEMGRESLKIIKNYTPKKSAETIYRSIKSISL